MKTKNSIVIVKHTFLNFFYQKEKKEEEIVIVIAQILFVVKLVFSRPITFQNVNLNQTKKGTVAYPIQVDRSQNRREGYEGTNKR